MSRNNHYSDENLEENLDEIDEIEENQHEIKNNEFLELFQTLKFKGLKIGGKALDYFFIALEFTIKSTKKIFGILADKIAFRDRAKSLWSREADVYKIYLVYRKLVSEIADDYYHKYKKAKKIDEKLELEEKADKFSTQNSAIPNIDFIYKVEFAFKSTFRNMKYLLINIALCIMLFFSIVITMDGLNAPFILNLNFLIFIYAIFLTVVYHNNVNMVIDLVENNNQYYSNIWMCAINGYNKIIDERNSRINKGKAKSKDEPQLLPSKEQFSYPKEQFSSTQSTVQQSKQEEVYDNPYADTWRTIFDDLFSKNIKDKFKVPEYREFEMTEVHIFNIPTLTVDILIAKSEEIGSYIGKRVYKIQRDYDGKIGRIGVKLITKEMPNKIPYSEVPETNENEIVIGKSVEGFVTWRFTTMPHGGVYGTTGGGKSKTMQFLISELEKKQILLYFADFKGGVGFNIYKKKNYTVIAERKDFAEFVTQLYMELKYRNKMLVDFMAEELNEVNEILISENKPILPRIFLIIDEFADAYSEEDKYTKIIKPKLNKLLSKGRAIGIHIFIGTQRPDASTMGGGAPRNNIPMGMTSRQKNPDSYKIALGVDKISKEDREIIRRIPDINFQGLFIVQGTDTINGKELVRVPFMEKDEYYSRVLNEWKNNPYASYELHYMSLDDKEDEDSEEDAEYDEETKEVLNKVYNKGEENVVEAEYEVIDEVEVEEVEADDSIHDYFDNLL